MNANFNGRSTCKLATLCIENRLKDKAKNDAYLKQKEDEETNKENREELRAWFRTTNDWRSGKFAAKGKLGLTDMDFLEAAREKYNSQKKKLTATLDWQAARSKKSDEAFNIAFSKYSRGETPNMKEMKSMMNQVKDKKVKESPFGKTKEKVLMQWEQRRGRLDKYRVDNNINLNESGKSDQICQGLDLLADLAEVAVI